jgi:hypothetical protein
MDLEIKYQGIAATKQDIEFIKKLIAENPNDNSRALSQKLCRAWNWVQPNGTLRDMVCRGFMLRLDSAGYIKLPPRKFTPNNPLVNSKKPPKVEIDQTPIEATVSKLAPLEILQVRQTGFEQLFNGLIAHHHYLDYPLSKNFRKLLQYG